MHGSKLFEVLVPNCFHSKDILVVIPDKSSFCDKFPATYFSNQNITTATIFMLKNPFLFSLISKESGFPNAYDLFLSKTIFCLSSRW